MGARKKYWLLTTEFPPFFGGGIGTYCEHTAHMYQEYGYEVTVFVADKSVRHIDISNKRSIRIVRFNPFYYPEQEFLGYETLTSFAAAETIKTFIQNNEMPDVFDCQEYNGLGYFILLYKHLNYEGFNKLKVLVTMHAPSFLYLPHNHVATYKLPYFWIGEMEKFCINAADVVIAPSQYIIDQVRKIFPECRRTIHVIRNPYRNLNDNVKHVSVSDASEYVFYGKASPLKGILHLLKLFVGVWEKEDQTKLRIIGNTEHYYHPGHCSIDALIKRDYERYILSGQLIMEGSVPISKLSNKISSAKAVIIPSVVDNFPYAVLECMSEGKVLLVSDTAGHAEIIEDGTNGFVFRLDESDSFYQKLQTISLLDSPALNNIGKQAKETVYNECNYERIYQLKEEILAPCHANEKEIVFPFLRQKHAQTLLPVANNNLLSVVIPYFNLGGYIDATIQSIFQSSYKEIEIIIVNDGSTDEDSNNILKKYESDSRIKIIWKNNEGLSKARNAGGSVAKGEYLAFLDADDLVAPTYFEKSISVLKHCSNIFFVGCWVKYFEGSNATWPCFIPEPPFVLVHNMANTSALIYKKQAFLQAGQNDPAMLFGMEDYDSLLSLITKGFNGVILPETLFYYRVRKNSMARQFNNEKVQYLYQLLASKHSSLFQQYGVEVSNLLNSNGPGYLYDNPTLDNNKLIPLAGKLLSPRVLNYLRHNKIIRKNIHLIKRLIKN